MISPLRNEKSDSERKQDKTINDTTMEKNII